MYHTWSRGSYRHRRASIHWTNICARPTVHLAVLWDLRAHKLTRQTWPNIHYLSPAVRGHLLLTVHGIVPGDAMSAVHLPDLILSWGELSKMRNEGWGKKEKIPGRLRGCKEVERAASLRDRKPCVRPSALPHHHQGAVQKYRFSGHIPSLLIQNLRRGSFLQWIFGFSSLSRWHFNTMI